jgi:hypothetical protein
LDKVFRVAGESQGMAIGYNDEGGAIRVDRFGTAFIISIDRKIGHPRLEFPSNIELPKSKEFQKSGSPRQPLEWMRQESRMISVRRR